MMNSLLGPSTGNSNSINIRRDVQDAFYRYKMPRLQCKIEGKGNGIKTVIPNMVEIAKALHRPPAYITKFFGAELGALSNCDEKAAKYIVNGAHEAEKLQSLLDIFIQKFVLCPNCDNPETFLSISKRDGTINRTCQACGHRAEVDMLHKLVSFIRANPPPKPIHKSQAKDRAEAAGEITTSALGKSSSSPLAIADDESFHNNNNRGGGEKEDNIEGMIAPEDFDDTISKVKIDELVTAIDDDDWDEATAAALRQDELSNLSEVVKAKLALNDKILDEKSIENDSQTLDVLDQFGDWLLSNNNSNIITTNEDILKEVSTREIQPDKALVVIIQVLLSGDFMKTFKFRLPILQKLVSTGGAKAQKALLGSTERLVGVLTPTLLPKTSMILQTYYNSDLVEEETLCTWREKLSKRYVSKDIGIKVRQSAQPFFEWLQNAKDSDSDEEDSDDGDGDEE